MKQHQPSSEKTILFIGQPKQGISTTFHLLENETLEGVKTGVKVNYELSEKPKHDNHP